MGAELRLSDLKYEIVHGIRSSSDEDRSIQSRQYCGFSRLASKTQTFPPMGFTVAKPIARSFLRTQYAHVSISVFFCTLDEFYVFYITCSDRVELHPSVAESVMLIIHWSLTRTLLTI